jgi:hypothetical protein
MPHLRATVPIATRARRKRSARAVRDRVAVSRYRARMAGPSLLTKRLDARVFDLGLAGLARLVRRPRWHGLARALLRGLAAAATRLRGVRPAATPAGLAAAWQRVFPSERMVPIERIDGDTAHAAIHVNCPLGGTGDVHACHRLMEFDRAVAARAGANFVVLESQAEPA